MSTEQPTVVEVVVRPGGPVEAPEPAELRGEPQDAVVDDDVVDVVVAEAGVLRGEAGPGDARRRRRHRCGPCRSRVP